MPLPVIRTQRLQLRPWAREDVNALHTLWVLPEVRRYLWDDAVIARELIEQIVDSSLLAAESHGIGYWALVVAEAPPEAPMAGFCGFRFIDNAPTSS